MAVVVVVGVVFLVVVLAVVVVLKVHVIKYMFQQRKLYRLSIFLFTYCWKIYFSEAMGLKMK